MSEIRVPKDLASAMKRIEELENRLALVNEKTNLTKKMLSIPFKIEKMEIYAKPEKILYNEWEEFPRLQKWSRFYEEDDQFMYYDEFLKYAKLRCNTASVFAEKMCQLYSMASSKIEPFLVSGREVDYAEFDDETLTCFAQLLKKLKIN